MSHSRLDGCAALYCHATWNLPWDLESVSSCVGKGGLTHFLLKQNSAGTRKKAAPLQTGSPLRPAQCPTHNWNTGSTLLAIWNLISIRSSCLMGGKGLTCRSCRCPGAPPDVPLTTGSTLRFAWQLAWKVIYRRYVFRREKGGWMQFLMKHQSHEVGKM